MGSLGSARSFHSLRAEPLTQEYLRLRLKTELAAQEYLSSAANTNKRTSSTGGYDNWTEISLGERFSAQRNEVERALPSEPIDIAVQNPSPPL